LQPEFLSRNFIFQNELLNERRAIFRPEEQP
jgi:hypothetical protein